MDDDVIVLAGILRGRLHGDCDQSIITEKSLFVLITREHADGGILSGIVLKELRELGSDLSDVTVGPEHDSVSNFSGLEEFVKWASHDIDLSGGGEVHQLLSVSNVGTEEILGDSVVEWSSNLWWELIDDHHLKGDSHGESLTG